MIKRLFHRNRPVTKTSDRFFALALTIPLSSVSLAGVDTEGASKDSDTDKLDQVIVTAEKREEALQNVPISISVVNGKDLDTSTAQGITDVLNSVPGVATQRNYLGGGTVIVIRGVAPSAPQFTGSSPVAYYLDYVPFGLVRSAVAPDANAYDMQQIEVLRGPQGTLYGASALSGVVRVLTHDADLRNFDLKARVSDSGTQYGSNNYRGDVAINMPLVEGKLAARAVLGYESNSGWIDQPNKENVNNTELSTYRLKINAAPTPELSIGLSAWSSHEKGDAPSTGYTFDKTASELDQPLSTNYDIYGAKLSYLFPWFSVSSETGYLDHANKGTLGLDVAPFNAPNSVFFSSVSSNVFSEEINLNSSLEGPWRWSAGAIYRRVTEKVYQYYTGAFDAVPRIHANNLSKSTAVFGELTRSFFQGQLELTAGLRHYHDDESQADQLATEGPYFTSGGSTDEANTPRGVATWHVNENEMAYVSYSEGFRSGYSQTELVLVNYPDFPPVRPDRLRNYEFGTKGSVAEGLLSFDISVYYMDWRDIQQQLNVPWENGAGVIAIVNGSAAKGIGTDLGISLHPLRNLSLNASVSWNNLEFRQDVISGGQVLFHKGTRPISSPETTASTSADYLFSLGKSGSKGRVSVAANYTSQQNYGEQLGEGIGGGAPMIFTRAAFTVEFPSHWTVTLFGDNLNNERDSPVNAFAGAPSWNARVRPRTGGIELEYHFR